MLCGWGLQVVVSTYLDLTTGQFTYFTHNPDDPNSLSDNSVYSIIQDSSGRLWFGTQNGLNLFDDSLGRFFQYHTYPDDPNSLKDDVIDRVFQNRSRSNLGCYHGWNLQVKMKLPAILPSIRKDPIQ